MNAPTWSRIRWSRTATNRSSLLLKLEYTAPFVKPAAAATSSREEPWNPLRAKTTAAAWSRCSRVIARRRSGVSGSIATEGSDSGLKYLSPSEILAGMILAGMSDTFGMPNSFGISDTARNGHRTRVSAAGEPAMLHIEDLHKAYGATQALAGVDLEVPRGTILGLLGPNGAGKTSLVSIVAGLRRPDRGRVRVAGVDAVGSPQRVRQLVGLAPQDTGVYPTLTVRANLRFFAGLAGMRRSEARTRADEVGAALGLEELFDRRGAQLSGGERRRLHTAIALVHRPALVLLDEPTTGADVRTRAQILGLVRSLADAGSAVVYSTHYLHEIEELDANVAFIDHGRIVARGTPRELVGAVRVERARADLRAFRAGRRARGRRGRRGSDRPHPRGRSGRGRGATPAPARRAHRLAALDRGRAPQPRVGVPHRHRSPI